MVKSDGVIVDLVVAKDARRRLLLRFSRYQKEIEREHKLTMGEDSIINSLKEIVKEEL
jgi:hypothetical protein